MAAKLSKINPVNLHLPTNQAELAALTPVVVESYRQLFLKKAADDAAHELLVRDLRSRLRKAKANAKIDELTNLPNRKAVKSEFVRYHSEARRDSDCREGARQVYMLCDIDNFKSINDTYGHDVGDAVLVEVAKRLKSLFDPKSPSAAFLRPRDGLARWGGEEFLLTLDGDMDEKDVSKRYNKYVSMAEKVRRAVGSEPIEVKTSEGLVKLDIKLSLGMAVYDPTKKGQTVSYKHLITLADGALYKAKGKMKIGHKTMDDPNEKDARNRTCYVDRNGQIITADRELVEPQPSVTAPPSLLKKRL